MRFHRVQTTQTALVASCLSLAATCLGLAAAAHATGDPAAGKALSLACSACHGMDGATGLDPTYPDLAGQNERYLLRQLQLIQSNERPILLMTGQLTGKSERDLENLAAYYASLPGRIRQAGGEDEAIDQAEAIYRGGILARQVPACMACHSPSGGGNAPAGFPRLRGQPSAYTEVQLKAYREGERRTDEDYGGMMRDAARGLTDKEVSLLADYLQGLMSADHASASAADYSSAAD
ncbi:MAG: c-type cytochrome [Gammaproteobacteria bacterium]|nr:c-type cytochrome [Gammaproteobacteria bacterium]